MRNTVSLRGLGITLGSTTLLGACALTHLQAPTVTPESVELADVQLQQQQFKVRLHVDNPNDRPLPIKSVSCNLEIGGVDVGKGVSAESFSIPAHGDTEFDMLVTTNFAASVPGVLKRVMEARELPEYHFSGWVNPDITLLPPIPFSKTGQITLP